MNRKMTAWAGAGKGGVLGASGLRTAVFAGFAAEPSRASKSSSAQAPKPSPACRSISRRDMNRERIGGWCNGFMPVSVKIREFVRVEQRQAEFRQGLLDGGRGLTRVREP